MNVPDYVFRWASALIFAGEIALWSLPIAHSQDATPPGAVESPLAACNEPNLITETVAIPNAESSIVQAQGAVLGNGPKGIIFSNESGNDPCPWVELAQGLANDGHTVLLYRYSGWTPETDVVGAVQVMRERGVESVILVGASVGATSSLLAGTIVEPAVDGVAALSMNESAALEDAAGQLQMPVLLIASQDDPTGSSGPASARVFGLLPGERHAVILPGTQHGYALLAGEDGTYVASVLTAFLTR